jgi:hypothetical protein
MRRLARRLFTFPSTASLLICVAVCVVWVRSYFMIERVGRHHYTPGIDSEAHDVKLMVTWGIAVLYEADDPGCHFSDVCWEWERWPASPRQLVGHQPPILRAIGIGWTRQHTVLTGSTYRDVQVRLALPASVSALAAVLFAGRRWRATRSTPGLCPACGYDLRASPERCPECGPNTGD